MMKPWKKIVYSLILVWTDILASLMVCDHSLAETEVTENEFDYTLNEDDNTVTIIHYLGNGGNVVIPSEIDGKPVTNIGSYFVSTVGSFGAFEYCHNVPFICPDSKISCNPLRL